MTICVELFFVLVGNRRYSSVRTQVINVKKKPKLSLPAKHAQVSKNKPALALDGYNHYLEWVWNRRQRGGGGGGADGNSKVKYKK